MTEGSNRQQSDEDNLQQIAEFMMASADNFTNETLAAQIRKVAQDLIQNKAFLARNENKASQVQQNVDQGAMQQQLAMQAQGGGGAPMPPV
jgi:hypothetical protein